MKSVFGAPPGGVVEAIRVIANRAISEILGEIAVIFDLDNSRFPNAFDHSSTAAREWTKPH